MTVKPGRSLVALVGGRRAPGFRTSRRTTTEWNATNGELPLPFRTPSPPTAPWGPEQWGGAPPPCPPGLTSGLDSANGAPTIVRVAHRESNPASGGACGGLLG